MEHGLQGAGVVLWLMLAALLSTYLAAALRQRRRGRAWSAWRMLSFTLGIVLVAVASAPGAASWAHQELRGHMARHLLLGMLAPLALVQGAPATLLLRSVAVSTARRISALLRHHLVRRLTHPVTALVLDAGGLYLLYLTPLFSVVHARPLLSAALHVHFLAAGYLFAASIAGPDPAPHRPRFAVRLAVLFAAIAAHGTLAKVMYAYGWPRGTGHGLAQIREAALLMYYGGDVAELLLAVALFASWYRRNGRRGWGGTRAQSTGAPPRAAPRDAARPRFPPLPTGTG